MMEIIHGLLEGIVMEPDSSTLQMVSTGMMRLEILYHLLMDIVMR